MESISYILPNWLGTGLVNQLFFIILGIINALKNNNTLLIIDKFRLEPLKDAMCPISEIIDMDHLNKLVNILNIQILDRKDIIVFFIDKILYGAENNYFDITDYILTNFYSNDTLTIPKRFALNDIKGDPIVGIRKKLKIHYQINDKKYVDEYDEYLLNGITMNLNNPYIVQSWDEIDKLLKFDRPLFSHLLKNIRFTKKYYNLSENLILVNKNNDYVHISDVNIDCLKNKKKINVIHLRLEKDMTYNMAGHNNMEEKAFIALLEQKYIDLIKKYLNKNDIIYVLAYELDNNVIKYLKENGYEYYYTKKNMFEWREPHAILDLLLSEKCSGTFIGNWQHNKSDNMGSTFSYAIDTRIKEQVNRIFIDLYDINKSELII